MVQLGRQCVLAGAGLLYPFIMTIAILWVTEKTVGLRVSATDQAIGLDASDIGERAYVVETSEEAVI